MKIIQLVFFLSVPYMFCFTMMGQYDENSGIDLTFPGCGARFPRISRSISSSNRVKKCTSGNGSYLKENSTRKRSVEYLMIGGKPSLPHSWPWMVKLMWQMTPQRKIIQCGASLISQNFVLTAAHCFNAQLKAVKTLIPSQFSVIIGSHADGDGIEYPVLDIKVHPAFKHPVVYHDISVLRIPTQKLSRGVYPVCLPSDGLKYNMDPYKNHVMATGWGVLRLQRGIPTSYVLNEAVLPLMPQKECMVLYGNHYKANLPLGITEGTFCAGGEAKISPCYGDSGGPVVIRMLDGSWMQMGITSLGPFCGQDGMPGVYISVAKYAKWIYDMTDLKLFHPGRITSWS